MLIVTGGDPSDRGAQFSNEESLKAYREQFDADKLEHSIQQALGVWRTCHHRVGPLAALHYLFAERQPRLADDFFDELASGRAKKVRAPSRFLQKRLFEIATTSNNRVHENVRNALIIKAWNAYYAGRTSHRLTCSTHYLPDPQHRRLIGRLIGLQRLSARFGGRPFLLCPQCLQLVRQGVEVGRF